MTLLAAHWCDFGTQFFPTGCEKPRSTDMKLNTCYLACSITLTCTIVSCCGRSSPKYYYPVLRTITSYLGLADLEAIFQTRKELYYSSRSCKEINSTSNAPCDTLSPILKRFALGLGSIMF